MMLPDPVVGLGRRELTIAAVSLVGMARFADRDDTLVPAVLMTLAVVVAGMGVPGEDVARRPALVAMLVPATLAGGAAAAIHLVPIGLGLVPALAAFALAFDRITALELRLLAEPGGAAEADRSKVLLAAVATAFVAFTGMAAIVPGGLAEPGAAGGSGALPDGWLVVLAIEDAVVALLLGYRLAALRYGTARDAARSALTYAIVVAIAAGTVRAIDVPRLVGPAVLTLVFYLWDALHGSAPARRRDPRFLWETILLAVLGVVVIVWNMQLRG
jgi:hypothetical protein